MSSLLDDLLHVVNHHDCTRPYEGAINRFRDAYHHEQARNHILVCNIGPDHLKDLGDNVHANLVTIPEADSICHHQERMIGHHTNGYFVGLSPKRRRVPVVDLAFYLCHGLYNED